VNIMSESAAGNMLTTPVAPPKVMKRRGYAGPCCDICGSEVKRKFGSQNGCIQPKCANFHMWQHLPRGVEPPPGLYGADRISK
jgi:hypothetical protein